jgi:hypothetical protein
MLLIAILTVARADSLTLDNGTTLTGTLAAYERGGSCTIAVASGELSGATVVLPCARITRFQHDPDEFPVAAPADDVVPVALDDSTADASASAP